MSAPAISLADQLAEVERELAMRERIYPKWALSGQLKAETGDRQFARLRAVRDTLRALRDEEAKRRKPELPL